MTTTHAVIPGRKRSFVQSWLPWLIVAGGAVLGTALWTWPVEMDQANRVLGVVWVIAPLTVILLAAWVLFFSGWRWRMRLAVVLGISLVVGSAFVASVREVRRTGDWMPYFIFRDWVYSSFLGSKAPDDLGTAVGWTPGDLSGNWPGDFPEYRGRRRDGVVEGPTLARDWQSQPPREVWKFRRWPEDGGFAGFAVAGNAAVTVEQRGGEEAVVCYDAATGKEVWTHAYPTRFEEWQGGPGPRATPTIADGDVYSLGAGLSAAAGGRLVCLDAATGKIRWEVDVLEGNKNLPWAMSGSPLVYDNVVVVNPGAQTDAARGRALVAYDRKTGEEVWKAGNARGGYSSPMLATLAGRRQILIFDGEGLAGHDAGTGKELWRHPWTTRMGINVAQPIVLDGDRVFISSGYDVGCAMLHVVEENGEWSVKPLWRNRAMRCKFTSPVFRQGYLYGLDDGTLVCVDAATGDRKWRGERYRHGQLLLADDLLLILTETPGRLVLVEASPNGFRELGNVPALADKTWNCPALAGGRVFIRNDVEMACYDLTGK